MDVALDTPGRRVPDAAAGDSGLRRHGAPNPGGEGRHLDATRRGWRDGPFGLEMAGEVLLPGPDAADRSDDLHRVAGRPAIGALTTAYA